ncbi:MAG TPA: adenine deaminase [Chitinophagales bacterium]|nr:adenine deaminase [Chitinophagales bacterium]HMW11639.1 adenine deaminase [Chitinophagales bacterium]HMX59217.1 adenine deaminase [Chitinophagales bacterium]HMZ33855.1 adenine deaminase [Chitinophagales bacterium]HNA39687.1 adenine deaminase [Chitinophagales bacterium]
MQIKSNYIDIFNQQIFAAEISIENGKIKSIVKINEAVETYILPGFVDAHVHIESSMLVPTEFAKIAVIHGTVATVSDPHEIANVLGKAGVYYMLENAKKSPLKFYFGAPSCVPATTFETAGAVVNADDIDELMSLDDIKYLAEMMNYPGVLHRDKLVMDKITIAQKHNKPIDGHAPGLTGHEALQYISAGITTDHECFTFEEAKFKLEHGMKVLIREGSAAKNFNALIDLLHEYPDDMMFCSDDKHPDDLLFGHINDLVKRAVNKGVSLFNVLKAACVNPVLHYQLNVGLLRVGDEADFIRINNLEDFSIVETYIGGHCVAKNKQDFIETKPEKIVNNFSVKTKQKEDFNLLVKQEKVRVIEAIDGQLITQEYIGKIVVDNDCYAHANIDDDILKMVVVNRYHDAPIAVAFVKNFGLKNGAIASSVAHDSHNIIAVGVNDDCICRAVNTIIAAQGGLAVVDEENCDILPLPVAGLMSNMSCIAVAEKYTTLVNKSKSLGCTLHSPFMTLSFMALLVIPNLKLSDKGLFDAIRFQFCDIEIKD